MNSLNEKKVLVSGASIAGLSTAYWMNKLGYKVTVVEIASELRVGGTAVDLRGDTTEIVRRMGILDRIKSDRLSLERWEFKNADDVTERSFMLRQEGEPLPDDAFEIERSSLLNILLDALEGDVDLIFDNSITEMTETQDGMEVTFKNGVRRSFDLVFGCDGMHSVVRKLWFGGEDRYAHFLGQYFSITIVDKLLIRQNTGQMFSVPGKTAMLNAYKNKTDIVLCFASEDEISYDHRDESQQRAIINERFSGEGWKTAELLEEVKNSKSFYFDKLCQIRMPSWTRGRVALVGDAAYCASPAAGMGGSLAMNGAAALADALQKHCGDFEAAFEEYNETLRPFIEEVQADAVRFGLETLVPRTEEAIRKRNTQEGNFF